MGRVMAIDLGRRRIGLAVSDPDRIIASPLAVIDLKRTPDAVGEVVRRLREVGDVDVVIVGNPVSLDGEETEGSRLAREFAEKLQKTLPGIEVRLWDERLSTVIAQELLHEAGKSAKKQKKIIDAAAAAVILRSFLDASDA